MRSVPNIVASTCLLGLTVGLTVLHADRRDLGREVLAANDGWAALNDGTTGGAGDADRKQ